jgi:hypothetical protein
MTDRLKASGRHAQSDKEKQQQPARDASDLLTDTAQSLNP